MAIQEQISLEKNEEMIGQVLPVLIDRIEGDYYIGRTEYDSPDIDDEVLIKSSDKPLEIGEFVTVRINEALEHDLLGTISVR